MKELRELSAKLLAEGQVCCVVGYEQGLHGLRPAFVTNAADVSKLVLDHRSVHDLVTYLPRRHVLGLGEGKLAVVVKPCDERALAVLERERQVDRSALVLIGVRCNGVADSPDAPKLDARTVASRCGRCSSREPSAVDYTVGSLGAAPPKFERPGPTLADIEALDVQERLTQWAAWLSHCTRCQACRQICPLCSCETCLAERTDPQWIESSPHSRGNFTWHLVRALHLAGRCVECGECERVCPAGIPLGLLSRKVASVVEKRFGYRASADGSTAPPVGSFRLDDAEEFIR